jgi:hypothetical protein
MNAERSVHDIRLIECQLDMNITKEQEKTNNEQGIQL